MGRKSLQDNASYFTCVLWLTTLRESHMIWARSKIAPGRPLRDRREEASTPDSVHDWIMHAATRSAGLCGHDAGRAGGGVSCHYGHLAKRPPQASRTRRAIGVANELLISSPAAAPPLPALQSFLDSVSDRYEPQPLPEREFQRDRFLGPGAEGGQDDPVLSVLPFHMTARNRKRCCRLAACAGRTARLLPCKATSMGVVVPRE
jgi:hypothetical protein